MTLEAFAAGTPVLGNAASDVVAGQLQRSGGGVPFVLRDDDSFRDAVRAVGEKRATFAKRARAFAAKASWAQVMRAYLEEIS